MTTNLTWQQKIKRLKDSGMSYTQIAEGIGRSTSAITELVKGRSLAPTGDAAVRLEMLFQQLQARKAHDARKLKKAKPS